jgi:hypothetical protein
MQVKVEDFTPPKIPVKKEKGRLGTKTNIDAATQL